MTMLFAQAALTAAMYNEANRLWWWDLYVQVMAFIYVGAICVCTCHACMTTCYALRSACQHKDLDVDAALAAML